MYLSASLQRFSRITCLGPIPKKSCLATTNIVGGKINFFDFVLGVNCRRWACLLCIFVPPPTSLIKVVNSGSFHWALSVFINFRSMSRLSRSCCRWLEQHNMVRSKGSLDFVRSRFTHPLEPELPSAQGRNEGDKGGTIPLAPSHYGGAEWLRDD